MSDDKANLILAFMTKQPMAVLSTVAKQSDMPRLALVAFAELPNFELLFETKYQTRK